MVGDGIRQAFRDGVLRPADEIAQRTHLSHQAIDKIT